MSSKADQQPAPAGKQNNPANNKFSGPLHKLVAAEKRIKNVEGKLHSKLAQKRAEFAQEFCSTPSESEQAAADWEATVEMARYTEQEFEAETRLKKSIQDEKNSGKLELPLQFDCAKHIFIDSKKQPSRKVPLRLADVIIAWFAHDPTTPGKLKRKLSYAEIGAIYIRGRIRQKAPATATEADLKVRLENRLKPGKGTASYATAFASDFTRWLKNNGVDGIRLFDNDKGGERYLIVSVGWHPTRPIINRAEASKRRAVPDHAPED